MPVHTNAIFKPKISAQCNLSGIDLAGKKKVELSKLQRLLVSNIAELDKAKDEVSQSAALLLAAQTTKATCDAVMSVLANFYPKGGLVESLYGAGTVIGGAAGTAMSGQKVNMVKTGADLLGAGVNVALARKSGAQSAEQDAMDGLMKLNTFKVKILANGLNNDGDGVTEGLKGYGMELISMASKPFDDKVIKVGKKILIDGKTVSKIFSIGMAVILAGDEISSAYRDYKLNKNVSAFDGMRRMMTAQLQQMERRVAELDRYINECSRLMNANLLRP